MHHLIRGAARTLSGWLPLIVITAIVLGWRYRGTHGIAAELAAIVAGLAFVAIARAIGHRLGHSPLYSDRVLILGTGPLLPQIVEAIDRSDAPSGRSFVLAGLVEETPRAAAHLENVTIVGTLAALDEILDEVQPGLIVLALADARRSVPEALLLDARMRGIDVEEGVTFVERHSGKLVIEALTRRSLILSDGFRHSDDLPSPDFSHAMTRLVSLTVAIVGLAVLAPFFAIVAFLIKLDSPGPVFFIQERVGRGGRPFGLIKFRTMREAGATRASEWVRDNTDRITTIGHVLRRFRLDELPQFVNVLRGEMNLVGPRPHPTSNYSWFLERIPYYALRSMVRPGITGWAQVRYGYANNLDEETEKMRYDLYYIKHRSWLLDLSILCETAVTLCNPRSHESCLGQNTAAHWADNWPGTASGVSFR